MCLFSWQARQQFLPLVLITTLKFPSQITTSTTSPQRWSIIRTDPYNQRIKKNLLKRAQNIAKNMMNSEKSKILSRIALPRKFTRWCSLLSCCINSRTYFLPVSNIPSFPPSLITPTLHLLNYLCTSYPIRPSFKHMEPKVLPYAFNSNNVNFII